LKARLAKKLNGLDGMQNEITALEVPFFFPPNLKIKNNKIINRMNGNPLYSK